MLRSYLLLYPFLAVYVALATVIFVPLTWVIRDIRPIYWASRQGVRLALLLSGIKVRTRGLEFALQNPTSLFVSNHVSNLDPPALFMVLPRIAVILKKELGNIPLLGYVMGLGGFIYVDRKARDSRKHALEEAVRTLRSGISLLVFPEGTRSPDGNLLPFRPGPFTMAIEAGAPIVPIVVKGARPLMPKGKLHVIPGEIELIFHPPIATTGMTSEDRPALTKKVRQVIEATLDAGD